MGKNRIIRTSKFVFYTNIRAIEHAMGTKYDKNGAEENCKRNCG
jgi:hypothetical protein